MFRVGGYEMADSMRPLYSLIQTVFHDATLFEILDKKPNSLAEMAEINGVGAAKLEKYGETFLAALRELDGA